MSHKVAIIDYEMGNIRSVKNMLNYINASSTIIENPSTDLNLYSHIILPGVGNFGTASKILQERGWCDFLNEAKEKELNILGICLGMQLMTSYSEEGSCEGLGWFNKRTIHFPSPKETEAKYYIPHMGWSHINPQQDHPIFKGLSQESRFYFVHSYYVELDQSKTYSSATSRYANLEYSSALFDGNIGGVQFHPEKSHKFGTQLFQNFLEL